MTVISKIQNKLLNLYFDIKAHFSKLPESFYHNFKLVYQSRQGLCGLACFQMIANKLGFELDEKTLLSLFNEFKVLNDKGTIYQNLINLVQEKFGLKGFILSTKSMKRLKYEVSTGNYLIVSVNPKASEENSEKGGHLIILSGFEDSKSAFFVKDPNRKNSWGDEISYDNFNEIFAGRGICFKSA